MNNKKKVATLLTLLASTTLVIGTVVALQSNTFNNFMTFSEGDTKITLDGTHGNVSGEVQLLKTSNVVTKTFQGNDISFDYKKVEAVSGKVGRLLPGGFYRNRLPLHDMATVRVVSNAATGNAKLYYGKTSAYMTEYVDLQAASTGASISGNFFKIVSDVPVEIESIELSFGCETKDYGSDAFNGSGNVVSDAYKYTYLSAENVYSIERKSNYDVVVTAVIPDYFDDGVNGQHPVTFFGTTTSSYGTFEGNSILEKAYIPETATLFGQDLFNTANKVKEFTLPLELTRTRRYPVPKNVETLNIHSRNLATCDSQDIGSGVNSIKVINVSYDVEILPNLISSWPSTTETIFYEGTTTEWASMATGKWADFTGDVICSDTPNVSNVTFHFENATLNGASDNLSFKKIDGRTIANPGTPIYNDGSKKFVGWFDDPVAGTEISFDYTVSGDADIYAHFEDYPAGYSFDDPIIVTMGQSYNYETDSINDAAYFKYTATSNEVITAKVTSAASAFNGYVYFNAYNEDHSARTLLTSVSPASDVSNTSFLGGNSNYGVNTQFKARLSAGEAIFIKIDGNGNKSKVGAFTIDFDLAENGYDYTTANPYNSGDVVVAQNTTGFAWYSFTPTTTGTYQFKGDATSWCSGEVGHFNAGSYVNDYSLNTSAGSTNRKLIELTADVEYFFAFRTPSSSLTFSVSDEIDPGISKASAIELTVGGSAETVGYDSNFPIVWYKFTATNCISGEHRLVISDGYTINTTSTKPSFAVTDSSDNPVTIVAGRTSHDKKIAVTAGEVYYVAITTGSSSTQKNFNFSVEEVKPEVTVNVYANGPETAATTSQVIDAGTAYVLADPVYKSNGYDYYSGFEGWYTDPTFTSESRFESGDIINSNTSIYAKLAGNYTDDLCNDLEDEFGEFIGNLSTGTYHFVKNGESIISTNKGITSSTSSIKFTAKKNFQLSFNYTVDSEWYNPSSYYGDKFKVTVKTNGTTSNALVDGGSKSSSFAVVIPDTSEVEISYAKDNSSYSDSKVDMVTITDFSITNISTVSLTYNFEDGTTSPEVIEVLPSTAITKPTNPTRSGFRFDNWYTEPNGEGVVFDFSAGISSDTAIYANWIEQVTVTIYGNGPDSAATEIKTVDKGSTVTLSNLNTSYYHGFDGWYFDSALTNKVNEDGYGNIAVNEDTSFYAKKTKGSTDFADSLMAMYPDMFTTADSNHDSYNFVYDSVEKTFTSGNHNVHNSKSSFTVTLKYKTTVSFFYKVGGEGGGSSYWDYFALEANGTKIIQEWNKNDQYYKFSQEFEAGDVLEFYYKKDSSTSNEPDRAIIKDLDFTKVTA